MVVFSLVFVVMQVWLDLKMPDYMSAITTLVQTPGAPMGEILENGGYMLLCAVGSMVAAMVDSNGRGSIYHFGGTDGSCCSGFTEIPDHPEIDR